MKTIIINRKKINVPDFFKYISFLPDEILLWEKRPAFSGRGLRGGEYMAIGEAIFNDAYLEQETGRELTFRLGEELVFAINDRQDFDKILKRYPEIDVRVDSFIDFDEFFEELGIDYLNESVDTNSVIIANRRIEIPTEYKYITFLPYDEMMVWESKPRFNGKDFVGGGSFTIGGVLLNELYMDEPFGLIKKRIADDVCLPIKHNTNYDKVLRNVPEIRYFLEDEIDFDFGL